MIALRMNHRSFLLPVLGLALIACSDADTMSEGSTSKDPNVVVLHPAAPSLTGEKECKVEVSYDLPVTGASHVPLCTKVEYATNPPSGGDHWPEWAAFRKYTTPVPREMYVHDLEHGAVVLAYACQEPCPDVVAALEKIYDAIPADPLCAGTGAVARKLLTPDPKLGTPIAVAAWGATYTATCIDPPSLADFVAKTYGKGPESTCAMGRDLAESGPPSCSAGD